MKLNCSHYLIHRLQTLPKETFRGLTKLRVLYLTGNHMDPTDAKEYRKGEILGNRLKRIPWEARITEMTTSTLASHPIA